MNKMIGLLISMGLLACSKGSPEPAPSAENPGTTIGNPISISSNAPPEKTVPPLRNENETVSKPQAVPPQLADLTSPECKTYEAELLKKYAAFSRASGPRGAVPSPDGRTLLLLTDQMSLITLATPTRPPVSLARANDRVRGIPRFSKDGRKVYFERDKDGNERNQVYMVSLDGKPPVQLTRAPEMFHRSVFVSPDGRTLYYLRGSTATPFSTVVAHPLDGGEVRSLGMVIGFSILTDISPDGRYLAVGSLTGMSSSSTQLVDTQTGKVETIAPVKDPNSHAMGGVFSADGKSLLIPTNESGDRMTLVRYDLTEKRVIQSFRPGLGEVLNVSSPVGSGPIPVIIDFGTNQGVVFLDPRTLEPIATAELSLTNLPRDGHHVSPDGKIFYVASSTPNDPTGIHAIDMTTGKATPVRPDLMLPRPQEGLMTVSVETIPSFDKLAIPTVVLVPSGASPGHRYPVVVRLHGGPPQASTVAWSSFNAFLASRGFAVVEPNFRGGSGFGKAFMAADNLEKRMHVVEDLRAVAQWLRSQSWVDPDRLALEGGSYGGYLTLMLLGHQPELWAAGVAVAGVVDLVSFIKNSGIMYKPIWESEFGRLDQDARFLRSISPIAVADRIRAPLLVIHGLHDAIIPRSEPDQIVARLRGKGVPVEYDLGTDSGHDPVASQRVRAVRFLEQHLKQNAPPKTCTVK